MVPTRNVGVNPGWPSRGECNVHGEGIRNPSWNTRDHSQNTRDDAQNMRDDAQNTRDHARDDRSDLFGQPDPNVE